jgi:cytochrome c553
MKTKLIVAFAAASLLSVSGAALAADAAAGKKKAEGCTADCHVPSEDFKGQKADKIAADIKGIASGSVTMKKKGEEHKKKLAKLSDADIADIAAYFASGKD